MRLRRVNIMSRNTDKKKEVSHGRSGEFGQIGEDRGV